MTRRKKKPADHGVVDQTHSLLGQGRQTRKICEHVTHVKNHSVVENIKEPAEYASALTKL